MPRIHGRKLVESIKVVSAQTPVILLTAWAEQLLASKELPPHVDRVVGKPPPGSPTYARSSPLFRDCATLASTEAPPPFGPHRATRPRPRTAGRCAQAGAQGGVPHPLRPFSLLVSHRAARGRSGGELLVGEIKRHEAHRHAAGPPRPRSACDRSELYGRTLRAWRRPTSTKARKGVRTFRFRPDRTPHDAQRFAANAVSAGRFNSSIARVSASLLHFVEVHAAPKSGQHTRVVQPHECACRAHPRQRLWRDSDPET